jgi:c-di-GMP-binding flagellar brake protein YcgR
MAQERRKYVRVKHSTKIKWTDLTTLSKGISVIPDLSKDISAGGIHLLLNKKIVCENELQLEFILPPLKSFILRGQVKWVREIELIADEKKTKLYHTGIEFLDITDEERDFIQKFVVRLRTI